jgi:hypothetical protein
MKAAIKSKREERVMNTKGNHHSGATSALILAAALCAFTPGLRAQTPIHAQQGQQQTAPQDSKTFTGTIQKLQNGQYALVTGQTAQGRLAGHFLDDQDRAKKYEGKQVKVTGTLDASSNTIHVTDIAGA